ncbi:MAG: glycosyltransferase, partial [Rhabdochlamydiaceae bacterium]
MNDVLLTLGMPTFERKNEIQYAIRSLLDGMHSISSTLRIELLVIDNASSFDARTEVERIVRRYDRGCQFRFIRNETNIGNDRNYMRVLEEASGEFILLCSDRYSYNIDFDRVIGLLSECRPDSF